MTKDEALKLALEALEKNDHRFELDRYEKGGPTRSVGKIAITAIREALAQPEQEPVVTRFPMKLTCTRCGAVDDGFLDVESEPTPPQRKPLTDEEIILIVADCASSHQHTDIHFARAIEAAHGIKE